MPRRRRDPSRLTSRVVHLVLIVCWIALVVWRIFTFISEPTASETRFEDDFDWPYLTVCPLYPYSWRWMMSPVAANGFGGRIHDQYENHTLLEMFKNESWSLLDMVPNLGYGEALNTGSPHRVAFRTWRNQEWTEKFNYAEGGMCSTLKTSEDYTLPLVRRNVSNMIHTAFHKKMAGSYLLFVHKLDDFWGREGQHFTRISESEMASYFISSDTNHQELEITPGRDIMPNLRRRPCVEDPSYSRSTCWRDCLLDSLNCSLLEGDTSGKPICMAADFAWLTGTRFWDWETILESKSNLIAFHWGDLLQCSCPPPCSLYRYKLSIKPYALIESSPEHINLRVSLSPVIRTTRTSITYDVIDLLADIGGFVGLLLGYSLYSVFEDVKNLVTKLFKRRAASAPTGPLEEVQQPKDSNGKSRRKKRQVKQGWRGVSTGHRCCRRGCSGDVLQALRRVLRKNFSSVRTAISNQEENKDE